MASIHLLRILAETARKSAAVRPLELCRTGPRLLLAGTVSLDSDGTFHGEKEEVGQTGANSRRRTGPTPGAALLAHSARLLVVRKELESRLAHDRLPDR